MRENVAVRFRSIVGATQFAQLEEALAAERIALSPAGMEREHLEELYRPHAVAGHR